MVHSAAIGVVVAREFTGSHIPDVISREGGVTSLGEEDVTGLGLEQAATINGNSNTCC
jgi:hypothetical protein